MLHQSQQREGAKRRLRLPFLETLNLPPSLDVKAEHRRHPMTFSKMWGVGCDAPLKVVCAIVLYLDTIVSVLQTPHQDCTITVN